MDGYGGDGNGSNYGGLQMECHPRIHEPPSQCLPSSLNRSSICWIRVCSVVRLRFSPGPFAKEFQYGKGVLTARGMTGYTTGGGCTNSRPAF